MYRVDSRCDLHLHLHLHRRKSPLDFFVDVSDTFGPVDEDGRPQEGNALYGEEALITVRS